MAVSKLSNLPENYFNVVYKTKLIRPKKITSSFLLFIFLAIFSTLLAGCFWEIQKDNSDFRPKVNIKTPRSEEDFIAFSLEADKLLMAVHNVNTPGNLKQYNIKPVKIKTKKDLERYLEPQWSYTFIDKKWREGSKNMPSKPFGFEKKDTGFLSASDVKFEKITDKKVIVSGKVCDPNEQNKFRIRIMSIEKTKSGWKATDVQYMELEQELKVK